MTSCSPNTDDLFAEAFACFEQGLCYDEINDYENAIIIYERGLNLVKEAELGKNAKKSALYKEICASRKRVEKRLKKLKKEKTPAQLKRSLTEPEKEKPDEWVMVDKASIGDEDVKHELREQLESINEGEAELVFFIPDGVQLFIIEGDSTSVPTYPCPLEIFRFNKQTKLTNDVQAEAFIKVGPWVYPLIPQQTPVLKNDIGAYVVSNPTPEHPNMFVGIILPSDLDEQIEEDFFKSLKQFTEVRTEDIARRSLSQDEQKRLSHKIATLLIKGGEKVAWGVNATARRTSEIVADQANKRRSGVKPTEQPIVVNPAIKTSVHYVHRGSKVVAKCTRYLLDKIGDMGIAVGRQLASSAEKRFGDGKNGGLVSGTIDVIGGGIVSASTVWMALEDASKTLCRNIANEAVDTVKIKKVRGILKWECICRYGDEASTTAHEALFATGHTTLAAFQIWDLGPRSIAGRAARKAGIQFVTELHKKQSTSTLDAVDETEPAKQTK